MDMIKANLTILLTKLARENACAKTGQDRTHLQERLDQFRSLLAKHVVNYKQPSDYAEMLNISPYQLNAITKTTLGKTTSEAITDYIILESKRHLLGTSNQVNQVASLLGYEDVSYFIRYFKKHTGLSPEAFRQNFR
jgi:YesN/AraC family two-component response regulator